MREILLSQGKVALVDDADYHELSKFKWYAVKHRNTFYARRNIRIHPGYGGQKIIRMHSVIMGGTDNTDQCDHIDGNGLNNQRNNLRIVTNRENGQNLHIKKTSKFPGVSYQKNRGKRCWLAHISAGSIFQKGLGYFDTEEKAYIRYMKAVNTIASFKDIFTVESNFERVDLRCY